MKSEVKVVIATKCLVIRFVYATKISRFFYIFVFQNGFELVSKGQFPFLMELLFFVAHNFE
jgi:hypothetical protein